MSLLFSVVWSAGCLIGLAYLQDPIYRSNVPTGSTGTK